MQVPNCTVNSQMSTKLMTQIVDGFGARRKLIEEN